MKQTELIGKTKAFAATKIRSASGVGLLLLGFTANAAGATQLTTNTVLTTPDNLNELTGQTVVPSENAQPTGISAQLFGGISINDGNPVLTAQVEPGQIFVLHATIEVEPAHRPIG